MADAMPKKMLVPVDLTGDSRIGLKEAADLAACCKAKLVVMYADEFRSQLETLDTASVSSLEPTEEEKISGAEKALRDLIGAVVPETVNAEPLVVKGTPATAILNIAKQIEADWIVMATHGRSGIKRLALGSVTEEVLRHTDRPLLAVHAG